MEREKRRWVAGTRQVLRGAQSGRLELVLLAGDADTYLRERILAACAAAGVTVETVPDMAQLGRRCGIDVGAACAGLVKEPR